MFVFPRKCGALCRKMTRLGKSGKITSVNADKRILIQMMSVLRFSRMSGRHKTDVCRRLVSQNHFHWTIFVSCFFVTKIQEAVFVREWFDAFPRPTNARAAGMTRAFVCGANPKPSTRESRVDRVSKIWSSQKVLSAQFLFRRSKYENDTKQCNTT